MLAERLLAANNLVSRKHIPHKMFATAPPSQGLQNGGVGAPVAQPFANWNVSTQRSSLLVCRYLSPFIQTEE